MLCGTTQLLFSSSGLARPFASHGKHLLPDSSGFYSASAGAGPPLRPFSVINIAFFAQICKENHCFAQKFSVSNRKYRLFLYSMTGQAHLPGHRSFCLFLCRSAGKVLVQPGQQPIGLCIGLTGVFGDGILRRHLPQLLKQGGGGARLQRPVKGRRLMQLRIVWASSGPYAGSAAAARTTAFASGCAEARSAPAASASASSGQSV